jgi:hypothetical protein
MKLHIAPGTCARATMIALEEAGAQYAVCRLDFSASEQTSLAKDGVHAATFLRVRDHDERMAQRPAVARARAGSSTPT